MWEGGSKLLNYSGSRVFTAKKTKIEDPVLTIDLTDEMDDDWLRARRLKQKALKGDQAELDRMESTSLVNDVQNEKH